MLGQDAQISKAKQIMRLQNKQTQLAEKLQLSLEKKNKPLYENKPLEIDLQNQFAFTE